MSERGRGRRLFGEYIKLNENWNREYANHLLRPAHRLVWCMLKLSLNAVTFTLFLVSSNMVQIEMNLFIMAYITEDGRLDYAKASTQGRDYKLMYTSVTDIKNFTHSLKIYMCKALWLLYWMLYNPDRITPISNICWLTCNLQHSTKPNADTWHGFLGTFWSSADENSGILSLSLDLGILLLAHLSAKENAFCHFIKLVTLFFFHLFFFL